MSKTILFAALSCLYLSGCASGAFKARQEQREKMAASTGMYCEFVSGDLFPDLDVELSLSMAKRCDNSKTFSITNYKNASDEIGVVYCCSTRRAPAMTATSANSSKKDEKSEAAEIQ